jgi:hypothetical protein
MIENREEHVDGNEVLFIEHYAAAQSLKNVWTRLASTYGCIMVILSRQNLVIKPHWFAKWLIDLLGLDLSHEISITNIRSVTAMGKWLNYGKVELRFETVKGEDRKILLYLKEYREFVDKATNATNQ